MSSTSSVHHSAAASTAHIGPVCSNCIVLADQCKYYEDYISYLSTQFDLDSIEPFEDQDGGRDDALSGFEEEKDDCE